MKTRKLFLLLLIFFSCTVALVFGTGEAETEVAEPESGELTFWHPYGGSRIESLGAAASKFESDNPGWTVKLEKIGWGDNMRNKWVTGLASDTLPDLFGATLDHALAMYDAGAGVDAEAAIDAIGGKDAFLEQPLETLNYKDAYIAVPHYGHAKCFYYRKDWLDEAGLDIPQNWEELKEAAAATTKAPDQYGFVIPMGKENKLAVDYLYVLMTSNGGAFFDEVGKVILDSPENAEAVEMLMYLYTNASPEGSISYSRRDRDDLLLSGKCGMAFEPLFTSATLATKAPDIWPKFGVAKPPAKKTVGWMSEHLVTVLCTGSDFEKKRLELIPYFYADEEYVRFLHHAPGGMLPVLKKTADSGLFWNNDFMQETRDDIQIAIEGYSKGTPVGMANGLNGYAGLLKGTDVIIDMLQAVASGKDISSALQDTQKELQDMIAEQQ
jgi:multiple sugar transport system substrate-binding protein